MITESRSFYYAATALSVGALAHVVGHIMGPKAIEFMGAPPDVVLGAQDKTLLYYVIMVSITGLLLGLAWLSFTKTRHKLSRICLWVFSVIFAIRGLLFLLFIPAIFARNFGPTPIKFWFHFFASIFILSIGLALMNGLWKTKLSNP